MTSAGANYYVYYTANEYTVTFDADGGSCGVAQKTVRFGETYGYNADTDGYDGLPIPVKLGYNFEGWYLGDTLIDESTAVGVNADGATLVARWKGDSFSVTIHYVKEGGDTAFESVSETLEFGSTYEYTSPELRGYTADPLAVRGTVPAQNTVITVTYGKNSYTLTIEYIYDSTGDAAAPTYSVVLKYGDSFNVTSPVISGYQTANASESGTIDASNVNITVRYYSTAPVVDVTISWGSMSFTYDKGTWNPDTHEYENGSFTPDSENSNRVTVTNNAASTVSVIAEFGYTPEDAYQAIDGFFTSANAKDGAEMTSAEIARENSVSAWFWLDGQLPQSVQGGDSFATGTCTVTIRSGSAS